MLKRHVLMLSLIFSFFASTNIFALPPLSCNQLMYTSWVDTSEEGFGRISLAINHGYENNDSLSYDISYYSDGFSYDEDGPVDRCEVQSDGSLLLTITQIGIGNAGSLLFKTSDLQTLTVLPPSSLENADRRPVAIHGPFSRA
jgi:hypothetical protein